MIILRGTLITVSYSNKYEVISNNIITKENLNLFRLRDMCLSMSVYVYVVTLSIDIVLQNRQLQ